jgi:hypothetical protein
MSRCIKLVAFAVLASGCATFAPLTPGSNADKGAWVAKSTGLMGLMLSNQEILYCSQASGTPTCTKAGGDVAPSQTGK